MAQNSQKKRPIEAPSSLSKVLGIDRETFEYDGVVFTVKPFRLGQLDAIKEMIIEMMNQSEVVHKVSDPETGKEFSFSERDLTQGFLKSEKFIQRLLSFCVTSEPETDLDDLPATVGMKLINLALQVNQGFFVEFLELTRSMFGMVDRVKGQLQGVGIPEELQPDKPIGQRSPLHFSPQE